MEETPLQMRYVDVPLLWRVEDVYTPGECQAFIERIEAAAPTIATNNPMYRNQDRVIFDDPVAADELFQRLRPELPENIGPFELAGLNGRLRCYRYTKGQQFAPHMDHWYRPQEDQITLLTVLVYFNDDFDGGQTRFAEQLDEVVNPKAGMVALFQHKVRHEGCEVRAGKKYAMRSDVIYQAASPIGKVRLNQA